MAAAGAEHEVGAEADRTRARREERARLRREGDEIQRALEDIVPGPADAAEAIAAELKALTDARARRDEASRDLAARQQVHGDITHRVTVLVAQICALERQLDEFRQREGAAREALNAALADFAVRLGEAGSPSPRTTATSTPS
jgi:chromosome segregation ATPase